MRAIEQIIVFSAIEKHVENTFVRRKQTLQKKEKQAKKEQKYFTNTRICYFELYFFFQ